jgi:GntR family transcriptional repressor for pyruvate dehydrogenase complex
VRNEVASDEVRLEPLRPESLKEQVVARLRHLVDAGVLHPGDQLPSERELSDQLQVSRGTVREAVQFLHALGIVEIRHGSGTFVRGAQDAQSLRTEWRRWTRRHADRVHELIDVRRALEGFAAELTAARGDGSALATMAGALAQMEDAMATRDVPALVQADARFHRALCEGSGNRALVELADALAAQLVRERAATWDLGGRPQRSSDEHRAIYDAVRSGDGIGARAALLAHLASVERDLARFHDAPAADGETRPTTTERGDE